MYTHVNPSFTKRGSGESNLHKRISLFVSFFCENNVFEEAWLIEFNVAKCHSMLLAKHLHQKQFIRGYSLHNQDLKNV